jgi:hypothetical protein
MKFTETRTAMQTFSGAPTEEYQMQYMATEVRDTLANINNRFVEYLTKDITNSNEDFDFRIWLTNTYYSSSNDNAKECLEHCLKVKHIYGRKIKHWTDSALKCYDNFLLKYIQEDRNETIEKVGLYIKERDVYKHLIDLGGDLQEIGQAFDNIYQTRNEFQHIQLIDPKGNRIPRNPSNSKCNEKRDLIVAWFGYALVKLLNRIQETRN